MFPLRSIFSNARRALPNIRSMSAKGPLTELAVDNEGIATLTMQRLPVNSLNLELLQEMEKALDEVAKNKSKGLIITSASPTVFSAGLDMMELYKPDIKRLEDFWSSFQNFWLKLYGSQFPTAAAVNGHAPAGGCLIAMSCEYRAMVNGKYGIGLNEVTMGIVTPRWFMDMVLTVIPSRQAQLALTTGKLFSVNEALKIGLIDDAASDKADAIAKCVQFIKKFDTILPFARGMTKLKLRGPTLEALSKNRERDLKEFTDSACSPRVQKGLEMFLESVKQQAAK